MHRLRRALHWQLDPIARARPGLSHVNVILAAVVVVAVAVAVLETEPTISRGREPLFRALEQMFTALFAVEYAARFYAVAERTPDRPWRARLGFFLSPLGMIDLLALLALFASAGGSATVLRLARLLRVARLAKLGRVSRAASLMLDAIAARRGELLITLALAIIAMLVSATLLYAVEGPVQPDKFGSIPRAMWWAVVTLTTIGYGDVYPVTALGKVLAGCTAVVGIGLIAAPTGILAAAFSEALQRRREPPSAPPKP
jgi:voltage-gated potassium channel